MPELPEVETITKQINRMLPLKIKNVKWSKFKKNLLKKEEINLSKSTIVKSYRQGKAVVMELDNGFLICRLGMSGGWKFTGEYKHTHLQITGKFVLKYVDPRRFGKLYLVRSLDDFKVIDICGPEFNLEYLRSVLAKGKGELKPFLLNQRYFPGIGNYLASEICYYTKLRPNTPVKKVKDLKLLLASIKKVIALSIKAGGLSFHGGYHDTSNKKGGLKTKVFWRKVCSCGESITKIKQNGRSSYFCKKCQN